MKYYLTISILLLIFYSTFGQKLVHKHLLDTSDISKWVSVSDGAISPDGKYALFTINNDPLRSRTLVVRETEGARKITFIGSKAEDARFSDDSKMVFFKLGDYDSLGILKLSEMKISYVPGATSFSLHQYGNKEYFIYENTIARELHIKPLKQGNEHVISGVIHSWLNKAGNSVIILRDVPENDSATSGKEVLEEVSLENWTTSHMWEERRLAAEIKDLIFSADGQKIAFITSNSNNNVIYYYQKGWGKAEIMLNDRDNKYSSGFLLIRNLVKISNDGKHLFYNIEKKDEGLASNRPEVIVDVWSYNDKRIQPQQQQDFENQIFKIYGEVIDVVHKKVTRLQKEYESMMISPNGKYIVLTRQEGADYEEEWNPSSLRQCRVLDIESEQQYSIGNIGQFYAFSEDNKYLIYRDSCDKSLYSYNLYTGTVIDLSLQLSKGISNFKWKNTDSFLKVKRGISVAGWLPGDKKLLLNDDYDVWLLDPEKDALGVCLTGGFGRSHRVKFWITGMHGGFENKILTDTAKIILCAFNDITKANGFYSIDLNHPGYPDSISMCSCVNDLPTAFDSRSIKRARNGKGYLVLHMSEDEAPNYYYSKDLKNFKPLSQIDPKSDIIWNTRRLLTWGTPSGDTLQGILYLPEDFDSTKKYPVILHYYREKSDEYHQFQRLRFHGSGIAEYLPWFTGQGYIIFMLDIHYKRDSIGAGIMEAINTGTDKLIKYPFIDSSKMGLQGHSFGGFETNYIISHTNRFSAAIAVSGPSEVITDYNRYRPIRGVQQQFIEQTLHTTKNLWEQPDIYIKNSPILNADKVSTPILLINNKEDEPVTYEHGVSFFLALRRLGKRVWLLQYDNEGHVVKSPKAVQDFLTKELHFFNHYLKGENAPSWMLQ